MDKPFRKLFTHPNDGKSLKITCKDCKIIDRILLYSLLKKLAHRKSVVTNYSIPYNLADVCFPLCCWILNQQVDRVCDYYPWCAEVHHKEWSIECIPLICEKGQLGGSYPTTCTWWRTIGREFHGSFAALNPFVRFCNKICLNQRTIMLTWIWHSILHVHIDQ